MAVGHALAACTLEPEFAEIHSPSLWSQFPELENRRLLVVDMPGFDGSLSVEDILRMIPKWTKE